MYVWCSQHLHMFKDAVLQAAQITGKFQTSEACSLGSGQLVYSRCMCLPEPGPIEGR